MTYFKCWIYFLSVFSVLYVLRQPIPTYALDKNMKAPVFSLQAKDEPLKKVFEKISKRSGYDIIFNAELGDSPVSIELTNVTVHDAIKRVLRKLNHIAIWDEKEKKLSIYIFESKGPPVSITGKRRIFEQTTKTTND